MKPLVRVSQTDVVVDQIKRFLLSDRIREGDKLPTEKEFCETLKVGRSTVREAIRALQVMGYVKIYPGRGAFLASKELDDASPSAVTWFATNVARVEDVVEVRLALETLAARLAAVRADEEEFERLERVRFDFEEALSNGEYEKLGKLDELFHQTMVEAAKNPILTSINKTIAAAFAEFRNTSFRIKEHAANAVIPHRDILNALRARDAELAQVFVVRHLEKVREDRDNTIKRGESVRLLKKASL